MSGALTVVGEGISKTFAKSGFSISVDRIEAPAGRTLALLGPSGSGKSTLLKILGLLERPDAGRVLLDGAEVHKGERDSQLKMAAVFQRSYLFKGSVEENVGYGLAVRGVPKAQRSAAVESALERAGLAGYGPRSALALSGGESQRVSLARALAIEPRVLLLDEPLANLDPLLKRRLTREFSQIVRDSDVTVIWVTHDQDEAIVVADHVAIMRAGSIAACGPAEEVMTLPTDEWTAAFLGLEEPVDGVIESSRDGLVSIAAGGCRVVAVGEAATGAGAQFAVRPEDVLLFEPAAELPASTARNRLLGHGRRHRPARGHHTCRPRCGRRETCCQRLARVDAGYGLGPGCLGARRVQSDRSALETHREVLTCGYNVTECGSGRHRRRFRVAPKGKGRE